MDWGEMFRIGLGLTLLLESPGEIQDLRDSMQQPTQDLVCYSFVDNQDHVVESNVRDLSYNETDRSWTFVTQDGRMYHVSIAETATCRVEESS